MMDFEIMEKALKIAWVNRIKDESGASWKIIPEQILTLYGGLSFLSNLLDQIYSILKISLRFTILY